jgi:hypothetical protein
MSDMEFILKERQNRGKHGPTQEVKKPEKAQEKKKKEGLAP